MDRNTPHTTSPFMTTVERIWRFVKDNGPITAKNIKQRMGLTSSQHSQISQLGRRGLLIAERLPGTNELLYSAVGDSYVDALRYGRKPLKVTSIKPPPAPLMTPSPAASTLRSIPPELENMTIAQLRATYKALHQLFGSQA